MNADHEPFRLGGGQPFKDLSRDHRSKNNLLRSGSRYPRSIAEQPNLIIQVPGGSAIERQLRNGQPLAINADDVLVQTGPTDDLGNLEAMAGEVFLAVPAPEELARPDLDLQRVLRQAGTGTSPLVVVVEAAEELEDDEAAAIVAAARHAPRPVILRIIRPSER